MVLPAVLSFGLLSSKSVSAQDQPPAANAPSKPLSQKDHRQQARKLAKESAPYATWLTEEVPYIITKEDVTSTDGRRMGIDRLPHPAYRSRPMTNSTWGR